MPYATLNAAQILSAPMVALSANSPFLFETALWEETRVPLFEQAVDVGDDAHSERRRVTFGSGYLQDTVLECYRENIERFPVLLPITFDDAPERLRHLRLHNGTIWRWNRLLVGCEPPNRPHLRVEHRVMPAGADHRGHDCECGGVFGCLALPGGTAHCARVGSRVHPRTREFLSCSARGSGRAHRLAGGARAPVAGLLFEEILPMAREGLKLLGADADDIDRYLAVAAARVRTGQNGAVWQRAHVAKYGRDFFRLTADYLEHQRSAMPVHEWNL